jgi:hypothetical protein
MAVFTTFSDILPTPNYKITYAGQLGSPTLGFEGPGYASVKVDSVNQIMRDKTNSGRLIARAIAAHRWEIDIQYNPMTRAEFNPVSAFLQEKQGGLKPFYVELPQYSQTGSPGTYTTSVSLFSGNTYAMINATIFTAPTPGDMFTISDSANSNHTKAYMVTRVETNADYNSNVGGSPALNTQIRLHFTPSLQKTVSAGSSFVFSNPRIKVVQKSDVFSYSLGTNNLYSFSLSLEEVQ